LIQPAQGQYSVSSKLSVYSIAVATSIFVLLLRYSLTPWLGSDTPLLIVVIAPIFASLYGTRPALLATALCLLGSMYFLVEPLYSFEVYKFEDILRLVLFVLVGISISLIGGYRLKSKQALERSMQRQQIAVDAADMGLFDWDLQEDTTLWENDRVYEIFGHARADGSVNLKQFLEHYLHKDDRKDFEKTLQTSLSSGDRFNAICRITRKSDRQLRLIEFCGRFQYAADNKPTKMIGVVRDITEQKSMESEIDRTRSRLQAILDSVPAYIYQVDMNGKYEFVNQAYAELFGYGVKNLVGLHLKDVFEAKYAETFIEHNQIVFSCREAKEFEESAMLMDGMHTYNSIKTPIFDYDGQPLSVLGISTDITERICMENQLRESDARKDEFLAVLGHELRNPLAPLSAGIELLSQVKTRPERLEGIQAMMQRQVSHLLRLVDDLLNMSRISRGLIELHRSSVDLNSIVPQALEQVEPIYSKRKIEVTKKCSDEVLLVDGDHDRLTQVVVNLLTNAAKFMDENGTVTITTYPEDGQAVLKVRDTGYGIAAEHFESIFQMFSQVSAHKTFTGGGGLGIGLALSQKLIEMHGGSICVSSEGPGLGSEFTIKLPLIP